MLTAENVHAKVLKSATLVDQIEETIEKQLRSQWALKMAVSVLMKSLKNIPKI